MNPIASYRNREWLYQLTGQVEKLANVTRKGFKELNIQLQATSRMTLQNRMALDMLLLKQHGVCAYLKDSLDHCRIHIPNVTQDVEHDLDLLGKIEKETETIREDMSEDWLGKIFSGLGWCKSRSEDQHSLYIVIRDMDSEVPDNGLFGAQLPIPGVERGAEAPEYRTV